MSRQLPLLILVLATALFSVLFFRVVRPFIFPLLFAAILALLFLPVHVWLSRRLFGRRRIAAALTTLAIVVVLIVPLTAMLTLAGVQLVNAGKDWVAAFDSADNAGASWALKFKNYPRIAETISTIETRLSDEDLQQLREGASTALIALTKSVYERTQSILINVIETIVVLLVMLLSLYYFLADGEKILAEARRLSPLPKDEEQQLLSQFDKVCRGVILGTVAAALAQGLLAAIAFALVGAERVWLLAVFTMFFSFIPFLGAAVVWIFVDLGLLMEQRYVAAAFLGVYGLVIISGADNIIKAHMLHDRAQMHPLVALVSVLGGLQLFGLWGMFIGPMVTAFFYALVNILHKRLVEKSESQKSAPPATPATPPPGPPAVEGG